MDQRKTLLKLVADHTAALGAITRRQLLGGLLQLLRAHVIGGGVDQIARQRGRGDNAIDLGLVEPDRRHQPHRGRLVLALAIAAKFVAAERERQRRQPQIVRRIGKAIVAGRQQFWQLPGPKRIGSLGTGLIEPEQHLSDAAPRRGQGQKLAGLALIIIGGGELLGLLGQRIAHRRPARFGDEGDRGRVVIRRGVKGSNHGWFTLSRRAALGPIPRLTQR